MTQEDKELLLKDLCARLPYGVKVCIVEDLAMKLKQIDYKGFCESWENEYFKCHSRWALPYLRPMSSMTDEEKKELLQISNFDSDVDDICYDSICCIERTSIDITDIANFISWLNVHHFDYRGLIKKDLAIEVTEEDNPYK